ncbi:Gfo/Idh/MocA family oxidoreductase [Niveispirillum sp. KHB5.9]|uniref:Gfo/Idh/MocA family oxidoreductase n=1 Tax=Niveispirillum sp. KHB5.9 TaxID=3400269 RepID=UPI003A86E301
MRSGLPAPLRLGIVGLGMAGGVMVQAALSHPGFRIAAAADPDATLRGRFAADFDVPVHGDIGPLLESGDVDAVYIATPHQMHRDHVVRAASAGKHVVVEKPMALSLADCDAMIAACDAADVTLIVGHSHGFDPSLLTARRLMEAEVGPAALVTALNYTDFLYRPRRPEELRTDLGGGVLFNQLPHQVDMVRTLVPSPVTSVRAVARALDPARNTEGLYSVLLEFADGAAATLTYSGHDGFDSDEFYDWVGEGGFAKRPAQGATRRALATTDEAAARRDRYGYGSGLSAGMPPHQPHFGLVLATCLGGDLRLTPDGVTLYGRDGVRAITTDRHAWRPGRGDVLEELYAAVRHGQAPIHDGEFGRATVQVCLAVLQSARERRDIQLGLSA